MRAGFDRMCDEFGALIVPLGFARDKARSWRRVDGDVIHIIHLHRNGSTYGATLNHSVSVRVHFAVRSIEDVGPIVLNGPSSDQLRDPGGYAYHLRFNARSWSTYDRCIVDAMRLVSEHGLPWFARRRG